jgi:1-phosphatidylinositol-3-phosphate 5-kinase
VTEHSELFTLAFFFNHWNLVSNSLSSFAKYLELLIYSTAIHSSSICNHTTSQPPSELDPSGTRFRFNFLRHFSTDTCKITFSLAEERDIFQLHLPRLQICRTGDKTSHPMCLENCQGPSQEEEERAVLRHQIRAYWEAVSDHLDKIVRG